MLGGPGSGKSHIAREAIARFTAEGRSPLFLCYTRALAGGCAGRVCGRPTRCGNSR